VENMDSTVRKHAVIVKTKLVPQ